MNKNNFNNLIIGQEIYCLDKKSFEPIKFEYIVVGLSINENEMQRIKFRKKEEPNGTRFCMFHTIEEGKRTSIHDFYIFKKDMIKEYKKLVKKEILKLENNIRKIEKEII